MRLFVWRSRAQPRVRYRRVVSGAKAAVSAAAVARTMTMSLAAALPSISPRETVAWQPTGATGVELGGLEPPASGVPRRRSSG